MGAIVELSKVTKPIAVVTAVINVANPTSFSASLRAGILAVPCRNSSKYLESKCVISDIATTNKIGGSSEVRIE